jgi:uracil-DNA glycosylase
MAPSPRRDPEPETPESREVDACEPFDDAEIDAFCADLLVALTQLERSPAAWNARSRARFN